LPPAASPPLQIIVTHDQEEAFDLADQVVIFNRGLIEQSGSPNEIIKGPATPFVMGFVGDTNSVPAGCMLVRRSGFQPNLGKARVMFRPSDIRLSKEYVATLDGQQVRLQVYRGFGSLKCPKLHTRVHGLVTRHAAWWMLTSWWFSCR
jgi:ABC-type sulfate/molybdate transport systems ATPase subunit